MFLALSLNNNESLQKVKHHTLFNYYLNKELKNYIANKSKTNHY